jgi:hypothetical protein
LNTFCYSAAFFHPNAITRYNRDQLALVLTLPDSIETIRYRDAILLHYHFGLWQHANCLRNYFLVSRLQNFHIRDFAAEYQAHLDSIEVPDFP